MPKSPNVLFLSLLFAGVSLANADEASKIAKIDQLFALAKIDKVLSQSISMIGNQLKSAAFQRTFRGPLSPEQQNLAKEFQDKLNQMLAPAVSWDDLKPIYVNLYAKNFSEEELNGMLSFYKSPAGQAMVTKAPQLMTEANHSVQQKVSTLQPKVQALMREYMEKNRTLQAKKQ